MKVVKKDKIVSSISSTLDDVKIETNTAPHTYDKSGINDTWFYLDNGYVAANCENWSEKLTKENGWDDKLKVRLIDGEFEIFDK